MDSGEITFTIALPFLLPLNSDTYQFRWSEKFIWIKHDIIYQQRFDPRLGLGEAKLNGVGFAEDPMGMIQYSEIQFRIDEIFLAEMMIRIYGIGAIAREFQLLSEIAILLVNDFIEVVRAESGYSEIKAIGKYSLASLTISSDRLSGTTRIYGNGLTLAKTGVSPAFHARMSEVLQKGERPNSSRLISLDATASSQSNRTREGILLATSALESAIDQFFIATWRSNPDPISRVDAAITAFKRERGKSWVSVESVLREASLTEKVSHTSVAGIVGALKPKLLNAIEIRNLVAHGQLHADVPSIESQVQWLIEATDLVLNKSATLPTLSFAETFIYCFEEAITRTAPKVLRQILDEFVFSRNLNALLIVGRKKQGPLSTQSIGSSILIDIPSRGCNKNELAVAICRRLLLHYVESTFSMPYARSQYDGPDQGRGFWVEVAGRINTLVVTVVADNYLRSSDIASMLAEVEVRERAVLSRRIQRAPIEADDNNTRAWADFMDIARAMVPLGPQERETLLIELEGYRPRAVRRAKRIIGALEKADIDSRETLLEALIAAHDAIPSVASTVAVFDPVSQISYGLGTRFEDILEIARRLAEEN